MKNFSWGVGITPVGPPKKAPFIFGTCKNRECKQHLWIIKRDNLRPCESCGNELVLGEYWMNAARKRRSAWIDKGAVG